MAKGTAEAGRLLGSKTRGEVTGWIGQRWVLELTKFGIFIIELGSKRGLEKWSLSVASSLQNSARLVTRCHRHDPLPQLLTTSLSPERMRPAKSQQQRHLSLLLSSSLYCQAPVPNVRRAQWARGLGCRQGEAEMGSLKAGAWLLFSRSTSSPEKWISFKKNGCFPSELLSSASVTTIRTITSHKKCKNYDRVIAQAEDREDSWPSQWAKLYHFESRLAKHKYVD